MFFYTKPFFEFVRQQKPETPAMPRGPKEKTPKTERVGLSPSEQAARIRRAARALEQGVTIRDLERRGFREGEVEAARAMIAGK